MIACAQLQAGLSAAELPCWTVSAAYWYLSGVLDCIESTWHACVETQRQVNNGAVAAVAVACRCMHMLTCTDYGHI